MMRMVEKRASTAEEAINEALDELGVERSDVDVEVVSEGRRGLFGANRRAHVRVTVRDGAVHGATSTASTNGERADEDAADGASDTTSVGPATAEPPTASDASVDADAPAATPDDDVAPPTEPAGTPVTSAAAASDEVDAATRVEQLNEEADLAADFVEGLLDILELPGDIEIEVDEAHAFVNVVDVGSGLLIGRRGATLDALQELVRAATQRQVERRSHVRVDIEGYRQRQLEKLKDRCREAIAEVRESGEPFRLEPMDAFERKVMHDLVSRSGGVRSSSEGVEPRRRVVIHTSSEE